MRTADDARVQEPDGRLIAIVGPTAVGKTAVAIELADRLDAEIVSADSMAVYRGMDIGTAKPTADEQRRAVFHMIDVVEPPEQFTVADFQEAAVSAIESVLASGKVALLVGGTGLYVKAVIDGLDIPSAPPNTEFRQKMGRLAAENGNDYVHELLRKVDAPTAERLHVNDLKRIIRALEVYEATGVPVSEMNRGEGRVNRYPDAVQFGLTMDRQALYRRIEERVDEQLRLGLMEEVRALLSKDYDVTLASLQGLGYKEIVAHLRGAVSLEEAARVLKQNTRRFAKRQLTWFRADKRVRWIDITDLSTAETADRITQDLRHEHDPEQNQ